MTIYCEGVAPGMTISLAFGRSADDYKQAFCHCDWTECRVARMLWAQYDDVGSMRLMKKCGRFWNRGKPTENRPQVVRRVADRPSSL